MRFIPALSRPMDLGLASNRLVLGVVPAAGTVSGGLALVGGESLVDSLGWGVAGGGAAFLAWAITRELHPDNGWVATIAAVAAPVGLLLGRPALFGSAIVLLSVRAVAGTTGRALRTADVFLFGVVGLGAVFTVAGPASLGVAAAALAMTAAITSRRRGQTVAAAIVCILGAVTSALLVDPVTPAAESWIVLGAGGGLGLATLIGPRAVESATDRAGGALHPRRVRLGRAVAVLAAAAGTVAGDTGAMIPVWSAVAATALRPF